MNSNNELVFGFFSNISCSKLRQCTDDETSSVVSHFSSTKFVAVYKAVECFAACQHNFNFDVLFSTKFKFRHSMEVKRHWPQINDFKRLIYAKFDFIVDCFLVFMRYFSTNTLFFSILNLKGLCNSDHSYASSKSLDLNPDKQIQLAVTEIKIRIKVQ